MIHQWLPAIHTGWSTGCSWGNRGRQLLLLSCPIVRSGRSGWSLCDAGGSSALIQSSSPSYRLVQGFAPEFLEAPTQSCLPDFGALQRASTGQLLPSEATGPSRSVLSVQTGSCSSGCKVIFHTLFYLRTFYWRSAIGLRIFYMSSMFSAPELWPWRVYGCHPMHL